MKRLILIFVPIVIASCAPKQETREYDLFVRRAVPGVALENTIHNIVDLVGHDFFKSNMTYISGVGDGELYVMKWEIDVDSLSGAKYQILIGVDPEGNLKRPIDLPDCRGEPANCQVKIDKETAIEIAKTDLDITTDFELVDIYFGCGGPPPKHFIWRVSGRSPKLNREPGATVFINAATGEVVETETWRRYEPPKRVLLPTARGLKSGLEW